MVSFVKYFTLFLIDSVCVCVCVCERERERERDSGAAGCIFNYQKLFRILTVPFLTLNLILQTSIHANSI